MSDELDTLNLRIDKQVKIKFKACASLNDESMTDAIVRLMKDYIKETENKTE